MKHKNDLNTITKVIQYLFVFIFFSYVFHIAFMINVYDAYTVGTIKEKTFRLSSKAATATYVVDGKVYVTEAISHNALMNPTEGDKYIIKYSYRDPENSTIMWDYSIPKEDTLVDSLLVQNYYFFKIKEE